jgi:NAD(P)-dependent dehydrogenase (short-subunit alcohol dehydrogenase family)
MINGRDPDAAQDAAASIIDRGGQAVARAGSPADQAAAAALIDDCVREFGQIDILVNCAGIAGRPNASILDTTPAEFAEFLESHLWTVFSTCRAAAPRMARQNSGTIVNTSSLAYLGDYGGTGYPAAKGGVNGFTSAIAGQLKEHGVRANVVCPGAKTRMSTGPQYEAHINDLRRRGLLDDYAGQMALDAPPPEFAAPIYAYLASDLAADITGEIFVAAGGFVGRLDRPTPTLLGYRNHQDSDPWSPAEIHQMVTKARTH